MMVGEVGLEPTRSCDQQILSLSRIPIPPLTRGDLNIISINIAKYYLKFQILLLKDIAKTIFNNWNCDLLYMVNQRIVYFWVNS